MTFANFVHSGAICESFRDSVKILFFEHLVYALLDNDASFRSSIFGDRYRKFQLKVVMEEAFVKFITEIYSVRISVTCMSIDK